MAYLWLIEIKAIVSEGLTMKVLSQKMHSTTGILSRFALVIVLEVLTLLPTRVI